jgi:hypothetical protein
VIVNVAEAAEQPVRLQLGAYCVARVEELLDAIRTELDAWREVAISTDFEASPETARSGNSTL